MDSKMILLAARAGVSDSSPLVRSVSIDVLAEIGNKLDIPRIIAALDDKKWEVRSSAADVLAHHRSKDAGIAHG